MALAVWDRIEPLMVGTWERILSAMLAAADGCDDIDWTISVDSTVCWAHWRAAGPAQYG
ncbi:hypothetical protein ACFCYH_15335 [Streptomyces sp. NPDC056400]|uniref:hypothetical protein n=1 Tax=Streptomyces sp. NPDC056400 TaxID=3345808 RepID=UPI0035DC8143